MYENSISRKRPGCIIFLLDRSDSMKRPWGTGQTLAEGAAQALNGILIELCLRSQKEQGLSRHYFDVGIFGYGLRPVAGGEGVEPAFGGALTGQTLVSIPELRDRPIEVRKVASTELDAPAVMAPVWVEPVYGYRTPMCEAMSVAGQYAFDWAQSHPDSFPPIVINITDGIVTDSPFAGASLREWAGRITSIATRDGQALLFNIFVSPDPGAQKMFPASAAGLPAPGPDLFEISSSLPEAMISNAVRTGEPVQAGAHGFAFNADSTMLIKFLEIGTRVEVRDT
jgi:hypothetical protein